MEPASHRPGSSVACTTRRFCPDAQRRRRLGRAEGTPEFKTLATEGAHPNFLPLGRPG